MRLDDGGQALGYLTGRDHDTGGESLPESVSLSVGEGETGIVTVSEVADPGALPYLVIDLDLMGGAEVEDVIIKVRGRYLARLSQLPRQLDEGDHRVEWAMEIAAETPLEAAQEALRIQRDPASIATVFLVDGEKVDLSHPAEQS